MNLVPASLRGYQRSWLAVDLVAGAHPGRANFAAGLSGTFVVNGSPTKTEILDEQKGRTQVANLTMSAVVLLVVLFATGVLTNMPKAVLAGIVFLIGLGLVDVAGLKRIRGRRVSEFVIACVIAVVVFGFGVGVGVGVGFGFGVGFGVGVGVGLAVVLSILEIIRRAYGPADFVVGVDDEGRHTFSAAKPGAQGAPGLVVFRYDAVPRRPGWPTPRPLPARGWSQTRQRQDWQTGHATGLPADKGSSQIPV